MGFGNFRNKLSDLFKAIATGVGNSAITGGQATTESGDSDHHIKMLGDKFTDDWDRIRSDYVLRSFAVWSQITRGLKYSVSSCFSLI